MQFQESSCTLCQPQPLLLHMTSALFEKYSTAVNFHHINQIDYIVEETPLAIAVEYRESLALADDSEYLKRPYQIEEWAGKIAQLGDYYKFSRDLPRTRDGNIIPTLEKYHEKLREMDFKKVKAAVKREQGISLTSYRQQSSYPDSNCEIKSRYSSVLHGLNDSGDDTYLLEGICQQIGDKMPESRQVSAFKGYFPQGTKKFQQFVDKQKRKSKGFCFNKKKKSNKQTQKLTGKQNTMKNGINIIRNRSKKSILKNYNEKTRANDTLSREQKSKKVDKYFLKTLDYDQMPRPLASGTILMKQQPKSTEQIYKNNLIHNPKYNSTKERKLSTHRKANSKNISAKTSVFDKNTFNHLQKTPLVLDTDRNFRETSKKVQPRNSIRKSVDKNKRRASNQSYKNLPIVKNSQEKQKRDRTLSRSKSKGKMSRNGSRDTLNTRQSSQLSSSKDKRPRKKVEDAKEKEEKLRIDRLLSKKLALFAL